MKIRNIVIILTILFISFVFWMGEVISSSTDISAETSKHKNQKENHSLSQGWNLKAAIGGSATHMRTHGRTPKKWHTGFDFASSIGYRYSDFDFAIGSYATLTKLPPVYIRVGNSTIDSDYGVLMSLTIGPKLTYYFTDFNLIPVKLKKYINSVSELYPFLLLGPMVSIQSMYFERGVITGDSFYIYQKLTYEGIGYVVGIGLDSPAIYGHELYVELLYKFIESNKMTIVGGTKKEVKTIYVDQDKSNIKEHTLIFLVGLKVL
ncbi:MAG: hypothetical protein HQK49_13545 [Oligoflexia bacterium]|nr:hypothetical protein [Oligoflexia bacterium]